MTKTNNITWILLIALTVMAGLVSYSSFSNPAVFILLFAGLKFLGITLNFMDIRKAHWFWKFAVISFLLTFCTTILIML